MGGRGGAGLLVRLPLPGQAVHDMALTLGVTGNKGLALLRKLNFVCRLQAQAASLWAFVLKSI